MIGWLQVLLLRSCPAAPSWATSMQLMSHERYYMLCRARILMGALAIHQVSARGSTWSPAHCNAGLLALHYERVCASNFMSNLFAQAMSRMQGRCSAAWVPWH